MAIKVPTASALDRTIKCPASQALPHITEPPGKAARKGTSIHTYLEHVDGGKNVEGAIALVPEEHQPLCRAIDPSDLPTDKSLYAAEVAVAYDYATGKGRMLGQGKSRNYGQLSPTEIAGTSDVMAWGQYLKVSDYKTGMGYVPAAKGNPQLLLIALAGTRALGLDTATVEIIRVNETGPPVRDLAEVDEFDLDSFALKVKQTMASVQVAATEIEAGRTPDVREGGWCKYCPAKQACPAKRGLLADLVAKGPDALAHSDMPVVYKRVRNLNNLAEKAMERLKALAREAPIEIGDGLMYGYRNGRCVEYKAPQEVQ